MRVIANGRPVRGRIIGSVDCEVASGPQRRENRQWDQVGFGVMLLTQLPFRIGSGRVEIAERYPIQTVSFAVPLEDPLDEEFGFAIWIDRLLRGILPDRQARR